MAGRRQRLGAAGEEAAATALRAAGWKVLDRNVRAGGVELDLVVARGGCIAFVEVKTRDGARLGDGMDAVDRRKRARLVRGAAAWLGERRALSRRARRVRFDVVSCAPDGRGGWRVRHLEGAFEAGE